MNIASESPVRNAEAHTSTSSRCAVVAGLYYLKYGAERPCSYAYEPPPGIPWENSEYELHQTQIADARRCADLSIDTQGFVLRDAPTAVKDFLDTDAVKTVYYPETAELALSITGAKQAHVFDHLIRRREHDRAALTLGRRGRQDAAAANGRVHNDYTEASGQRRLGLVVADAAAVARTERYAIMNIWRSIKGPVLDTPLAVFDARTVAVTDLVTGDVRYSNRTGEIYFVTHSRRHRWSYFSEMDRHEALVFKQYDSQVSGVARFTPHAAFDHPSTPPDAPLRESIELRCLVVYK
jgi:hypothetical protein